MTLNEKISRNCNIYDNSKLPPWPPLNIGPPRPLGVKNIFFNRISPSWVIFKQSWMKNQEKNFRIQLSSKLAIFSQKWPYSRLQKPRLHMSATPYFCFRLSAFCRETPVKKSALALMCKMVFRQIVWKIPIVFAWNWKKRLKSAIFRYMKSLKFYK